MARTFSRPLWLLLLVLPGLASAQDRLALVVGIDRYEEVADLQKATNDARAIGDALATVGFAVTALTDVDEYTLIRRLRLVAHHRILQLDQNPHYQRTLPGPSTDPVKMARLSMNKASR